MRRRGCLLSQETPSGREIRLMLIEESIEFYDQFITKADE